MSDHYRGLVAELYDVWFPGGASRDEAFFRERIAANGGTALEIGCGTGRLLLPYLAAGLAVEGIDTSPDMLAVCRAKAERANLSPVLHEQAMERLELPARYRTIFVPLAALQLVAQRADALEALRRFHAHLEPGGELALTCFIPWKEMDAAGEWKLLRTVNTGAETVVLSEAIRSDRPAQTQIWFLRYDVYRGRELARSEMHVAHVRWYYRAEMELMLELAGFRSVESRAGFDDRGGAQASDIIFLARS